MRHCRENSGCMCVGCVRRTRIACGDTADPADPFMRVASPITSPACPPDPTWSQPPFAIHNGLLAAATARLLLNTGTLGTLAAGIGTWYFFSGKWWR